MFSFNEPQKSGPENSNNQLSMILLEAWYGFPWLLERKWLLFILCLIALDQTVLLISVNK